MTSNPSYYDSTGSKVLLGNKLAEGGEAEIYSIAGDFALVAKIYKTPSRERSIKLAAMLESPPMDPTLAQGHKSICWPQELIFAGKERMVGFLMSRVDFTTNRPVLTFYHPESRRRITPGFTWQYLVSTAMNICSVAEAIHSQGHVIGDVNESNFLVSTTSLITLVDCDSMQVRDPKTGTQFRCPVGKGEFTAPELQDMQFSRCDRDINSDCFGLGVLFFLLLMEGFHPFVGSWRGHGESPTVIENIRDGRFPFLSPRELAPSPAAPRFEILPVPIRELFSRCFVEGHTAPQVRPRPAEWRQALMNLSRNLTGCSQNQHHWFGAHLDECPWCERTQLLGGIDPFPQQSSVYRPPVSKPVFMPSPAPPPPRTSSRPRIPAGLLLAAFALMAAAGLIWAVLSLLTGTPISQPIAEISEPPPAETAPVIKQRPSKRSETKTAPLTDSIAPFVVSLNEFDATGNPSGVATTFAQQEVRKKGLIVYLPYIVASRAHTLRVIWSSSTGSGASSPSDLTPGGPISIVADLGKDLPADTYAISVLLDNKVLHRSEIRIEPDTVPENSARPVQRESVEASVSGEPLPDSSSYPATHRHLVSGCSGTLLLTKNEIRFTSTDHSFHFLRSEVTLDGDGIKDPTGKDWHLRISNQDVRSLLTKWSAGTLFQ
jgi:serine/threonine protein kinase